MSRIYVETDNSDPVNKIYSAREAGKVAARAETIMQEIVRKIISKAAGFTINKIDDAKGYTIKLKVSKVEVTSNMTNCNVSGSIEFRKGVEGPFMVSTSMNGKASATGTSDGSLLDCIAAITEDLAAKAVPMMRQDFVRR